MASAQVVIQPVYKTMFSELRQFPRMQVVYHPNCRLPSHVDRSYDAHVSKVRDLCAVPTPDLTGKDRFKYSAVPKKLLPIKSTSPDFQPPSSLRTPGGTRSRNRGTQSVFRESSAQTRPWQPDAQPAEGCETTPEVMYLDKLEWGPGIPYRTGDLPADFHTTEIINKMRHARRWAELVEKGRFPRWMKKQDAIISDVETKDWIFREAEIDELQDIRLTLLNELKAQQQKKKATRVGTKLAKLWAYKKNDMERKIEHIRRTRDREIRKLTSVHGRGGRLGLVQSMRAARGAGSAITAAQDPTSDLYAPRARHGYQASRRHGEITYDPSLLDIEDHNVLAEPPAWLHQCGQNLTKTCSGHHLPRDQMQLCERETKWSEQFLENLHNDLKKARLGAALTSAGPLRILKPRRLVETPRPPTPEVESVPEDDEVSHQAALLLQKILRGRAVQNLMYEGRTRAAELTEELKTTHGLQKEDRAGIAKEEAKARDYQAVHSEVEHKEEAISALVEELCGGAVSAALDFLEKELRRLKEERRQHAFILIALREKSMREAAEAGRRQKEEHRRREHDEMFKQVLGVTQESVDAYLHEIIREGVELGAEADAVKHVLSNADKIDQSLLEHGSMSTAEQNELVAELVQQFLLPEAHKVAARHHVSALQAARLDAARSTIFGTLDEADKEKEDKCNRCGEPLDYQCKCVKCDIPMLSTATDSRDDPRWKSTRRRDEKRVDKTLPPSLEVRRMLNELLDDAVAVARYMKEEKQEITRYLAGRLREDSEVALDAMEMVEEAVAVATGEKQPRVARFPYRYYMKLIHDDVLDITKLPEAQTNCPKELPSEIRRKAEAAAIPDPNCYCENTMSTVKFSMNTMSPDEILKLLPTELRLLEEMRRCKCDTSHTGRTSPVTDVSPSYDYTTTTKTPGFDDEDQDDI
ncbi:cilia- and flagella-associated protein 91 [Bicyclus anynana]|uniref:Cilia- and flagella-associated protein 91 n=1 Tax=Bicyclus anynana TaxID=110368 RepID=A0A6J1NXK2_BICAN|nr:cilia- and flagella-associated protein 91 [Bicyclus anynana]